VRVSIIAHWYTPPYLVDLVDLVSGPKTEAAVVEGMRATVLALGQVPIVLRGGAYRGEIGARLFRLGRTRSFRSIP
jgi:3-hydroxyacyl-CoA dehydrogenase